MKAADAKAPKFDSKWWKLNKAKSADANGAFEKALKDYEDEKQKFEKAKILDDIAPLGKKLEAVMKQAKATGADSKLGVLQKETKDSLVAYEKLAGAALKGLTMVARDKEYTANMADLIKNKSKSLYEFCKSEYSPENYEFLVIMSASGIKDRKVYDTYVVTAAKKAVNLKSENKNPLDAFAAAGPTPDLSARWAQAPWQGATKEIFGLMQSDTLPRYRKALSTQLLKRVDLP